jgi:hypothetical protein
MTRSWLQLLQQADGWLSHFFGAGDHGTPRWSRSIELASGAQFGNWHKFRFEATQNLVDYHPSSGLLLCSQSMSALYLCLKITLDGVKMQEPAIDESHFVSSYVRRV